VNEAPPPCAAEEDWAVRYEQLRNDVLSHGIGSGFGLSILLRQGMTAWMRACTCAVPVPLTAGKSVQSLIVISPLPCDVRTQAAVILAGMLLTYPTETTLCKATSTR
jgi:hypothetical protein